MIWDLKSSVGPRDGVFFKWEVLVYVSRLVGIVQQPGDNCLRRREGRVRVAEATS